MASSTDPLIRSRGGQSRTSVKSEPFDHLIQHLKQYDPMLYEAFRKLSLTITSIGDRVTNISQESDFQDLWYARVIIPGALSVANDVLVNRFNVEITVNGIPDFTKKIVLDFCSATVKVSPSSGDTEVDLLRSQDFTTQSSPTWTSIFGENKIKIAQGETFGIQPNFAITELFNRDVFRADVLTTGSASGFNAVLIGHLVDL